MKMKTGVDERREGKRIASFSPGPHWGYGLPFGRAWGMNAGMVEANIAAREAVPQRAIRQASPVGKLADWVCKRPGLNLVVVLPTVLAAVYYAFIASPQYVSHAYFVVRGPGVQAPSMFGSLLQQVGSGGGGGNEDTYAVQTYMMSRDAARTLIETQNLRAAFDRPDADFIARFPAFFRGRTFEHFFRYYQNHVIAELDTETGISNLTVRTFSAQDSQRIGRALIGAGERLVNEMNERQRRNMIASSQKEVTEAEDKIRRIELAFAAYRNKEGLLDPLKQSVPMLQDIDQLKAMLVAAKLQIAQVTRTAPNSPLLPVYQHRVEALQDEIARANKGITGPDTSLVPKITAYDDLTVQREIAERELAAATVSLQTARAQADRQQLYLDEIAKPDLPDYPEYPHSVADILIVFATGLGVYAMGLLLISGAREHQIT